MNTWTRLHNALSEDYTRAGAAFPDTAAAVTVRYLRRQGWRDPDATTQADTWTSPGWLEQVWEELARHLAHLLPAQGVPAHTAWHLVSTIRGHGVLVPLRETMHPSAGVHLPPERTRAHVEACRRSIRASRASAVAA